MTPPRRATPADAPALAILHRAVFADGWSGDVFRTLLTAAGVDGFVVESSGLVLARTVLDEAEIITLCVKQDRRRAGLGAALLAAAAAAAKGRGAVAMYLEVEASNEAARGLYERAGFAATGRRQDYYGRHRHALVLRADLGRA